MTRADTITASRLVLTPVFILLFFLPEWLQPAVVWSTILLWLVAVAAELTDYFDGAVARKYNEVSDFGKVFDPFADVLMHMSFFICLAVREVLPLAFVLVVLYREFGIMLVRMLCAKKGVMMGARKGGKVKTVSYVVTGGFALLRLSLQRLNLVPVLDPFLDIAVIVLSVASGALAILSFLDYVREYRKLGAGRNE